MSLENNFRNAMARALGTLFPVEKVSPARLKDEWGAGRIRRVLIIRQNQGLGDLLLATPVLRALKESRPDTELDFLASDYNEVAVRHNRRLNRVFTWHRKEMRWPWRLAPLLLSLRRRRYDLAILVSSHVPSFTAFLYARLINARLVLAYDTRPFYGGALWSRWMAHFEAPVPPGHLPEAEKFAGLVAPLGLSCTPEPEFYIPPEDACLGAAAWAAFPEHPRVGLFLGGNPGRPDRLWRAENWAALAADLEGRGIPVVAIVPPGNLQAGGGAAEKGFYGQVCGAAGKTLPSFSERDLYRLAAFLRNLSVLVCPDGGLLHVAAAARVRTAGLFFQTPAQRWAPGVPWVAPLQSPTGRPDGISVAEVAGAVLRLLDMGPPPAPGQ
jgi:ADP-heptose:LPS heptosyltransferase